MTYQDALTRVRRAVCAIGYLRRPLEVYLRNPKVQNFEIMGSGFIIGPRSVVTCAHVITKMNEEARKKRLPGDRMNALFVFPKGNGWSTRLVSYQARLYEDADIGLLTLDAEVEPEAVQVSNPESSAIRIGEDVGLVSYGHGSKLIYGKNALQQRFGPIFQRGYVSALAPYEAAEVTEILLDLVAAPAASGGPVFRIKTGEVIGVLQRGHVGDTATTSMAIPIAYAGGSFFVKKKRTFQAKVTDQSGQR